MSTLGERGRATRTCARCGRNGRNAFEQVADGARGEISWVCTHADTCSARRRSHWRADRRASMGRPASSPLLAWTDEGRQSCVIGADPDAVSNVEHLLRELTPLEVESLDPSPRSLSRLSRGTYCVVVVDAAPSDPLAYCNELYRRLSSASRRQLPIVICSAPDQPIRPPLRRLADRPNVRLVQRPIRAGDLVTALSEVLSPAAAHRAVS